MLPGVDGFALLLFVVVDTRKRIHCMMARSGVWLTGVALCLCLRFSAGSQGLPTTRIVDVKVKGRSCIAEQGVVCIFSKSNTSVTLFLEYVYHNHLHLALAKHASSENCESGQLVHMLVVSLPDNVRDHVAQVDVELNLAENGGDYDLCVRHAVEVPATEKWIRQITPRIRLKSIWSSEANTQAAVIIGLRAEGHRTGVSDNGHVEVSADTETRIRLFGLNFTSVTSIRFTTFKASRGASCDDFDSTVGLTVSSEDLTDHSAIVMVTLPESASGEPFYMCLRQSSDNGKMVKWIHQGSEHWLAIHPHGMLMPLWLQICILALLLTLSGLFSGLNLGLMAMDPTELKILQNAGSDVEKLYAKRISPVRKLGNYLLCTLLFGNVLVNSSLTIILDGLTSGIVAIIGATLGIVIFGEIIPQAICSRHGLMIGAKTIWITKFFMLVTFPLSFPISKILDLILGVEIGNVYNRERLKALIRVTDDYHDLEKDEVNIISGALELSRKTVVDVMTKLEDVFMLPYNANLDFETMSHIMKQGYTRIPVFEDDPDNIVALLNIKDLAFVDPDDNTPLKTLCQFYNHSIQYVFEDTTLDVMLSDFKKGKSHMAIVQHINAEGEGDPFYEVTGVVTLEDVIEEIIQSEIIDETDVVTDNKHRLKRKEALLKQDFSAFAQQNANQHVHVSPQMALATFQYLSTAVTAFKAVHVSETVLRRLMRLDIFTQIKLKPSDPPKPDHTFIYQADKLTDYFVLILEGRVEVSIGKENLKFECGPFTFFGVQALLGCSSPGESRNLTTSISSPTVVSSPIPNNISSSPSANQEAAITAAGGFIPDYTVRVVSDVLYLCVKRSQYQAAVRATLMERQLLDPNTEDSVKNDLVKEMGSDILMESPAYPGARSFRISAPNSVRGSLKSVNDVQECKRRTTDRKSSSAVEKSEADDCGSIRTTLPKDMGTPVCDGAVHGIAHAAISHDGVAVGYGAKVDGNVNSWSQDNNLKSRNIKS